MLLPNFEFLVRGTSLVTHSVCTTRLALYLGRVPLWLLILYVPLALLCIWAGYLSGYSFCMYQPWQYFKKKLDVLKNTQNNPVWSDPDVKQQVMKCLWCWGMVNDRRTQAQRAVSQD
uniref:Uncharacterized protein n=1 Tax=Xenopus tropicalis TaxID=8364 RepID=A0A1B8Y6Y6_XENTR